MQRATQLFFSPPIHDQDAVVGHVEHWAVAVVEALAGLAVPVPDEAEADVPGFRYGIKPKCVNESSRRLGCDTRQQPSMP